MGPIVGSTREFYKKLLARHLNGDIGQEAEVNQSFSHFCPIIQLIFQCVNLYLHNGSDIIFFQLRMMIVGR